MDATKTTYEEWLTQRKQVMPSPEDVVLCSYYRARDDDPVTIEALEQTFPRIKASFLASIGARLERLGWIRPVPEGGHKITQAGIERYLAD